MKISVITLDSKASGDVSLNSDIFGLPVRKDVLHRMVEWQRAKKQAGTHKVKTISEIRGTTAKPFKQKGTGNARQGSRRATQFVGGQTVFGPVVRSHSHKLTKKFRILGLKTALSAKQAEGSVVILDSLEVEGLKTKDFVQKLHNVGWKKPLIVDSVLNESFVKAARNVKHVDILPVAGVNVLDIIKHKELVLTKSALQALEGRLS